MNEQINKNVFWLQLDQGWASSAGSGGGIGEGKMADFLENSRGGYRGG